MKLLDLLLSVQTTQHTRRIERRKPRVWMVMVPPLGLSCMKTKTCCKQYEQQINFAIFFIVVLVLVGVCCCNKY